MKQQRSFNWNGMLTIKNIEQVASMINSLLKDKKFIFILSHENTKFKPNVRANLSFKEGQVSFFIDDKNKGKEFAILKVDDNIGVTNYLTNLYIDKPDPDFKNPFIQFDKDKVTITYRASGAGLTYRVAIVQG